MTDHAPQEAPRAADAPASSAREENPRTFPEGIPVRDMMRVKYEPRASNEVLIITGYSGAGRTGAARALEDLDWYVVDNLPPSMLPALVGMMSNDPAAGVHRLAVGVDVRSRTFFRTLDATLEQLKGAGIAYRIIFLEASPQALVRRYESNRRPHPLQGAGTLMDGIKAEIRLLAPLRRAADYINQKQLISLIDDTAEPLYQNSDAELFAALRDFDAAYTAYADFQRQMEAYWSLVYLQQQGTSELTATILKEDLVRIEGLPLVTRATGIPFDALPKSQALFKITELDAEKQFIALNYQKAVLPG